MILLLIHFSHAQPWAFFDEQSVLIEDTIVRASNRVILPCEAPFDSAPLSGEWCILQTQTAEEAIQFAQTYHAAFDVWPDLWLPKSTHTFNDPLFDGQWYLDYLQIEELFEHGMGNPSIQIAVIDSGIDISHPDLQNKIIAPIDVVDADEDPSPRPGDYCFNGQVGICDTHGTAVAGIALAQADNDAGMVGVCPDCSLVPIRMLGEGAPLSSDIAAFQHAFDQGVDVINNSWGYNVSMPVPTPLADVIQRVASEGRDGKGTVIVFAAGNEDREIQPDELCAMEEVLCISAIDSYERPTQYTNYGSGIDLTAPSATVSIAPNNQSTTNFGGTSAAAPIVSGLIGWLLSEDPTLSRSEVHNILIDTAIPSPLVSVDENGHHPFYGYGVISPKNLLDKLYPAEDPKPSGCRTVPLDLPICTFIVLFLFRRR